MSYNVFYKRLSTEAERMKRREVQLQLSRFVETYQVVTNPTDADLPDLNKFLQILTILSRQYDFMFSDKELYLLSLLYGYMRRDVRSFALLGPINLSEMILLEQRRRVFPIVFSSSRDLRNVADLFSVLIPPCLAPQSALVVKNITRILGSAVANMQMQLDVLLVCHKFFWTESGWMTNADTSLSENEGVPDDMIASLLNHVLQSLRLPGMMQGAQTVTLSQSSSKEANRRRTSDKATTELDGNDCIDRFTLLNLANIYTPEQLMHMEVFAVLKRWLGIAIDMKEKMQSGSRRDYLDEVINRFREDTTELVQRLLDQCDRPLGRQTAVRDQALMESCLMEAVDLLGLLVRLEPNVVNRLYPRCQSIFDKQNPESLRGDMASVMVRLMAFLVSWGPTMGVLPERFLDVVYGKMITAGYFKDSLFVDELVRYTIANLETLCVESTIREQSPLRRFSPNIWKILAWNPRGYLSRFMELLPAFLGEGSSLENLHTILELPCLTAVLEYQRSVDCGEVSAEQRRGMARLTPYFDFLLREESGRGDTLDKMMDMYDGLAAYQRNPRVLYVCDTVTPLLTVFFKVVLEFGSNETLSDLLPIILDRAVLLFGPEDHCAGVQEALGNALQALVALHPSLIASHEEELVEYIAKTSNISRAPAVYTSVLCVVGKFTASIDTPDQQQQEREDILRRFYEAVECQTYELLSDALETPRAVDYPFWCTVAMTLAKVAVQIPDYAPRCILCLSKIRLQVPRRLTVNEVGRKALNQRVGELSQLLKNPNIGPHVLCPRADVICDFTAHRDPRSLAMALKEVDRRMV